MIKISYTPEKDVKRYTAIESSEISVNEEDVDLDQMVPVIMLLLHLVGFDYVVDIDFIKEGDKQNDR